VGAAGFLQWTVGCNGCCTTPERPSDLPSGNTCLPHDVEALPINESLQLADRWCWAATMEIVASAVGHPIDQCEVGRRVLRDDSCPCEHDALSVSRCNHAAWPRFGRIGFYARATSDGPPAGTRPLEWAALTKQLSRGADCLGRPFVWVYDASFPNATGGYEGGGSDAGASAAEPAMASKPVRHAVVVYGYEGSEGGPEARHVYVYDPANGNRSVIPFDSYAHAATTATGLRLEHREDYVDVTFVGKELCE
jgi:hypothetical protein